MVTPNRICVKSFQQESLIGTVQEWQVGEPKTHQPGHFKTWNTVSMNASSQSRWRYSMLYKSGKKKYASITQWFRGTVRNVLVFLMNSTKHQSPSTWECILAELGTFHGPGVIGAFLLLEFPFQEVSGGTLLDPLVSLLLSSPAPPLYLPSFGSRWPLRFRVVDWYSDTSLRIWDWDLWGTASLSTPFSLLWRRSLSDLAISGLVSPVSLSCRRSRSSSLDRFPPDPKWKCFPSEYLCGSSYPFDGCLVPVPWSFLGLFLGLAERPPLFPWPWAFLSVYASRLWVLALVFLVFTETEGFFSIFLGLREHSFTSVREVSNFWGLGVLSRKDGLELLVLGSLGWWWWPREGPDMPSEGKRDGEDEAFSIDGSSGTWYFG